MESIVKRTGMCRFGLVVMALVVASLALAGGVAAEPGVVEGVLFYSPTCGHCHYVMTETLPPLMAEYGDQLQVVDLNIGTAEGQALYQAAVERFDIPDDRRGVPTLIVGETVLVGSVEIPEQLPAIIEQYRAAGGVGLPDIPGLQALLAAEATPEATAHAPMPSAADSTANPAASSELMRRLGRDPLGNTLAVGMLAIIVTVLVYALRHLGSAWAVLARADAASALAGWRGWLIAALCVIGLGVSVYLAYVETTHTPAVCGPVGDCNTVQQSDYAVLLGLVPVGVLGVVGYAVLLSVLMGGVWASAHFRRLALVALFGLALFGTLFSAYLTFLEPFVIGATCIWCLTSALSMTLILALVTGAVAEGPSVRLARR